MSETPRTDALTGTFYLRCDDCSQPEKCERMESVHPEDARKLELDLATAQERIAQLTKPGEYTSLIAAARKRAEIRREIPRGEPDRISDQLEALATAIEQLQANVRLSADMLNDAQEKMFDQWVERLRK